METATADSGTSESGNSEIKSGMSAGPYTTTIVVNGHVDSEGLSTTSEPKGTESSEILLTPTEAAAAGDIVLTFDQEDHGKNIEVREPAVLTDTGTMGNTGSSVDITPVKLTTIGEKVPAQKGTQKALDDVLMANSYYTIRSDGCVNLRMTDTGYGAVKPITMMSMLSETVQRSPNHIAMGVKRNGEWRKWNYTQYERDVKMAAKSLIKLGLEPHHGVGILGFNSPEWFITYMAGIYAGAMSTGIYATNSPEACEYVLSDCEANVIVVENHQQLVKILKVWSSLPHLKAIVQYTGEVAERRENIYSWEEFMNLSSSVPDSALEERLSTQAPNTCCSLIYTSGTTGNPKAVMLSHDNLTWTADMTIRKLKGAYGKEVYVSYLPLSHIAAQMLDLIIPIKGAYQVYFAQPDALKGTLVNTWKEIKPTGVLGVPRVWEKLAEKLQDIGRQTTGIKKSMSTWAKGVAQRGVYAKMNGKSVPWGWTIANMLLKKVHGALGLDKCTRFGSGAAPISKETLDYFASLNMPLLEVYGMSECSGPHTFCVSDEFRLTSVGKELYGVETKIDKPDADGNGELCYWGRHVFMGYLNKEEQTHETIQKDGWLHSGDIGKKDDRGFLYVTGRIKELIITAGGENIPPVPIEDTVKEYLPSVSNCMLIGDKKKFLSMLITLKVEVNQDTMEPLDNLTVEALNWCKSIGSNATTVTEALRDETILVAIQAGVDKANERAVSRAAKVQKWSILPKDFSLPGGELGPTLKLRRPIVVKKYEKTITAFYEEE